MSEEVVEKVNIFKKSWKYIVTGVTCAAVGVGVTLGADAAKVQDTLTKAQAKQLAVAAAAYSAEQVLTKVTTIATAEKKTAVLKEVAAETEAALPTLMEGVTAVKESVTDAKTEVTTAVQAAKEEAKTVTTPAQTAPAAPAKTETPTTTATPTTK